MFMWPAGTLNAANITPRTADTLPPVARALELVSGDIGRIPIDVQTKTDNGYESIPSAALDLLKDHPNEYQSGYEFLRYMVRTLMIFGNAGALIRKTRGGELLELVPLMADTFQILYRADGSVYYSTTELGQIEPEDILHFRLSGYAPLWGDSPVVRCRATLDLLAEQEQTGRAHFSTGAVGKLALTSPEVIGEESVNRLRQAFAASHGNAGSISTRSSCKVE
jgi:HK97 family phage portal protein